MRSFLRLLPPALILVAGFAAGASAQRLDYQPPETKGMEIEDHSGQTIPEDLEFTDEDGRTVRIGDYLEDGKPLVLQMVYFECPMLCNLVLNGFVEGAKGIQWTPGKEYRVVTVSFDPKDTPEAAQAKKANYVESLGRPDAAEGWHFLVGDKDRVRALADAVGFPYRYLKDRDQFAHSAGIFVIDPEGRISRTLYGIEFKPQDLRFSLMEASKGRLGTPLQKLVLFCFHYDASRNAYGLVAINVMKIGGLVTVAAVGTLMAVLWYRERHRRPKVV